MIEVEILQQKGFNFLWIDNELVMWDIPVERKAQREIAEQSFGEILIAGYGLGVVQQYLTENPRVRSILTIERLEEVVRKAERVYGRVYGNVEIGNFFGYNSGRRFDCVIGDIWKDIVPESLVDYKRFKQKAQTLLKPNGRILTWGQEFFEYLSKNNNSQNQNP